MDRISILFSVIQLQYHLYSYILYIYICMMTIYDLFFREH